MPPTTLLKLRVLVQGGLDLEEIPWELRSEPFAHGANVNARPQVSVIMRCTIAAHTASVECSESLLCGCFHLHDPGCHANARQPAEQPQCERPMPACMH